MKYSQVGIRNAGLMQGRRKGGEQEYKGDVRKYGGEVKGKKGRGWGGRVYIMERPNARKKRKRRKRKQRELGKEAR